jgi:membrane protein implicated in regulation of membrane protease activity
MGVVSEMLIFLSYVGAHWALIVSITLLVIGLGVLAFFLKNWKIAAAAILIVAVAMAFQAYGISEYTRRVNEEAVAQVETLKGRMFTLSKINDEAGKRAVADQDKISKLESDASATPANPTVCLDAAAASRVRRIK